MSSGSEDAAPETDADVMVRPGLSIHFVGPNAGIYCHRLMPGRGFAELPVEDLAAIVDRFSTPEGRELLQVVLRRTR